MLLFVLVGVFGFFGVFGVGDLLYVVGGLGGV